MKFVSALVSIACSWCASGPAVTLTVRRRREASFSLGGIVLMLLDGLVPAPGWLNSGDTAWQVTAATLVGIQSVPGLAILYAGLMKRKWALNSALMVLYAFAMTLLVWTLWSYNMSFGNSAHLFGQDIIGTPWPVNFAWTELSQASIPLLSNNGLLPPLRFPTSA